ncbi:MAG: lysine--tRNA ligase [Anaerolineales bacterium]
MAELNDLERVRADKMRKLQAAGMPAYASTSARTHTAEAAIRALEAAAEDEKVEVTVAGRLKSIRDMGKTVFAHIEDGSGPIQLYLRQDDLGDDPLDLFKAAFDLGDYIEAGGWMFHTRSGEPTVHAESFRMLSKAITPLPTPKVEEVDGEEVVHDAFSDPEARYRQRYVDLAVNPEVRQVFQTRARMIGALREYLDTRGFVEVETPVLQPVYGGAAATPFITHHNQLHQDLFLRISFELYLKRLLVGNLERVYEIGRDFRNEGVSYKHNPEFTQLEFYMAYADYRQVMEMAEGMISYAAEQATGSMQVEYGEHQIDLTPPWKRMELGQAIRDATGIDLEKCPEAGSLRAAMVELGDEPAADASRGKLIDSLIGSHVEPALIQPTFLFNYPRDISPLARRRPDEPDQVERFEGFVGGMEMCNAFSELIDPFDQEQRFLEMGRTYERGDEERHPMDEDYLRAMRYGMPPNGGFGMGVDRLAMLLTNRTNIREVILFPHLRQIQEDSD